MASRRSKTNLTNRVPITKLMSAASVGKAVLRQMGVRPLLEKEPTFSNAILGFAMSSYYGGRAEVRVRKLDVPIRLVDFTSMYATVFILGNFQQLLFARRIRFMDTTSAARSILTDIAFDQLFEPSTWASLTMIVKMRPNADVLPVRFRYDSNSPFQIAVTHFTSDEPRWYTFADAIAAKLLGGSAPEILEAIAFQPEGQQLGLHSIDFRGQVRLDPKTQIFKTIVEERTRHRDVEASRFLVTGLKTLASSAAYGIYAETNVVPHERAALRSGRVYGAWTFETPDLHEERPGQFANPILATLVTGAARLMLAMLEISVTQAGGTYAFCDTDSLAIVSGDKCPAEIPNLARQQVLEIIGRFNQLNPYDRRLIPQLLKLECEDEHCFAVSAKRYVRFRWIGKRVDITHASEHGLGGLMGITERQTTPDLARVIWSWILASELGADVESVDLSVPARRQLPIHSPEVLKRFARINKGRPYELQVKPYNFLQTVTPAVAVAGEDIQPVAPFARGLRESQKLPWIDLRTGAAVNLDWRRSGFAGTVPVQTLEEFAAAHARHPEAKAADAEGNLAGPDTRGLLHRLHIVSGRPMHIGKEIDRIEEDEGIDLDAAGPVEYAANHPIGELHQAVDTLRGLPNRVVARMIGMAIRSWKRIKNGHASPSDSARRRIIRAAAARKPTTRR